MRSRCLSWLHIGDLHARRTDGWCGPERLKSLLAEAQGIPAGAIDFIFLPGDNANEGEPEQYGRLLEALKGPRPEAPIMIIPGDHDFVPGNLNAFGDFLAAVGSPTLPARWNAKGRRALFLDVISPGVGGPSFALGDRQALWLQRELNDARLEDAFGPVVFMHAFPGDLAGGGEAVSQMFARAGVALVDTGHTHYNEVINDGQVVYTAARSTAQIEEGGSDAYGFALVAVDGDQASFKFRPAGAGWPFVMITSPADIRLAVQKAPLDAEGRLTIRAKVLGAGADADVRLEALDRVLPLTPVAGEVGMWSATWPDPWRETLEALAPPQRRIALTVRAETSDGVGEDVIQIGPRLRSPPGGIGGAYGGAIGAWESHGVLGTRLGPNAFGRDW